MAGKYHQRLHALDVTTGAEIGGSPTTIQATYPTTSGTTTFDPKQYEERARVVAAERRDLHEHGRRIAMAAVYRLGDWLQRNHTGSSSVLNVTPNGSEGAIWMAGDGPAADASGNIYFLDANGTFDDDAEQSTDSR